MLFKLRGGGEQQQQQNYKKVQPIYEYENKHDTYKKLMNSYIIVTENN